MKSLLLLTNIMGGSVRPLSPVSCKGYVKVLANIVEQQNKFDIILVSNSAYNEKYCEDHNIPPCYITGTPDQEPLYHILKQIDSRVIGYHTKRTVSALGSSHTRMLISRYLGPLEIFLGGFSTSIDVFTTAIDLINMNAKITVLKDLTCCFTEETKLNAINRMEKEGIICQ